MRLTTPFSARFPPGPSFHEKAAGRAGRAIPGAQAPPGLNNLFVPVEPFSPAFAEWPVIVRLLQVANFALDAGFLLPVAEIGEARAALAQQAKLPISEIRRSA